MLKAKRVYVTQLPEGGIIIRPCDRSGIRYKMIDYKGNKPMSKNINDAELGRAVRKTFEKCKPK